MSTINLNIREASILLVTLDDRLTDVKVKLLKENDERTEAHLMTEMFTLEDISEKVKEIF